MQYIVLNTTRMRTVKGDRRGDVQLFIRRGGKLALCSGKYIKGTHIPLPWFLAATLRKLGLAASEHDQQLAQPRPGTVVMIDGKPRAVVSVEYPGGWVETEHLGDVLARSMMVGGLPEVTRLADAMIMAGWTPPREGAQL